MRSKFWFLCMTALIAQTVASSQNIIILTDSTQVPEVELREIEVRASKTNVQLKKMPASVTILTSDRIRSNEIGSLTDISSFTPGFFMPDYGSKLTSPVYIRGIGSRINSPSVGLYVDNVPYFEKSSYNFDFFDIERIEVLKGPQGTLYGRNAMGGLINVISRSPMTYQGTKLSLTGGSHGRYSGSAAHYDMIGDSFGYSVAVNYLQKDGYYTNEFLDNKVDRSNSAGFRNKLIWKPSKNVTLENSATFEWITEGGYPYAVYDDSLGTAMPINYNQPSSYERKLFSEALTVNYSGEKFEIQSTTAFQFLDDIQQIDQDFTPDSGYFVIQDQVQHVLSHETIFRSPKEKRYNWLFGVYGFMQQFDKDVDVSVYRSNMNIIKKYHNTVAGAAIFHQSTVDDLLVEGLSLTAGLRVDLERDILDYRYDRAIGGAVSPVADTIYPNLSYNVLLPKLALNYQMDWGSIYALVARGYKAGGFNSTFYNDDDLFFLPEFSINYETGMKTNLFNSHVYADLSIFYIDITNQQIYQPATYPDGSPAPGSLLKNAGKSESKGAEVTLKSTPFYGFTPSFSYGYTHATFTEHVVDEETDHTGNFIPYVPKNTVNFQVSRSFIPKAQNIIDRAKVIVIYRGLGGISWNEENTFNPGYYSLLDFKVAFERKGLSLEFWGKNMLNSDYYSFYFQALGNEYVQTGKPLRFGINLNFEF